MKTRTLLDSALVTLLREAKNGRTIPEDSWDKAFIRFYTTVNTLGKRPCTSGTIRLFERVRIELLCLEESLKRPASADTPAFSLCRKARAIVESELRLIDLRLKHPELDREGVTAPRSPLYLSDEANVSDIVELIAPIFELKLCRTESGRAPLKTIIAQFESMLNIKMPNYPVLRCAILKRQHLTPLLDRMREVWVEASQK